MHYILLRKKSEPRIYWLFAQIEAIFQFQLSKMSQSEAIWLLAKALSAQHEVEISVVSSVPESPDSESMAEGIRHRVLGQTGNDPDLELSGRLRRCAELVHAERPDLVHIHGTERFYGLLAARRMIDVPVVISLHAGVPVYLGSLPLMELLRIDLSHGLPRDKGLLMGRQYIHKLARQEREILERATHFLGRTTWNLRYILSVNRRARYYPADELLGHPFNLHRWALNQCLRYTIVCADADHPRSGIEPLLSALARLNEEFPDVQLLLAGNFDGKSKYVQYLQDLIRRIGLGRQVKILERLDALASSRVLLGAHVHVTTSIIEKSPNSLCEAMALGMPCVACTVGGIDSEVDQEQDGLLYPVDDAAALAEQIRRIFLDDSLARRLGRSAQEVARRRHDPDLVVHQVMEAYQAILNQTRGKKNFLI